MPRYQFIVAATLAALEQDLNRVADDDPAIDLKQILQAQGVGYVAVVERCLHPDDDERDEDEHGEPKVQQKPRKTPGRHRAQ